MAHHLRQESSFPEISVAALAPTLKFTSIIDNRSTRLANVGLEENHGEYRL
jgi:hypothetical protein